MLHVMRIDGVDMLGDKELLCSVEFELKAKQ